MIVPTSKHPPPPRAVGSTKQVSKLLLFTREGTPFLYTTIKAFGVLCLKTKNISCGARKGEELCYWLPMFVQSCCLVVKRSHIPVQSHILVESPDIGQPMKAHSGTIAALSPGLPIKSRIPHSRVPEPPLLLSQPFGTVAARQRSWDTPRRHALKLGPRPHHTLQALQSCHRTGQGSSTPGTGHVDLLRLSTQRQDEAWSMTCHSSTCGSGPSSPPCSWRQQSEQAAAHQSNARPWPLQHCIPRLLPCLTLPGVATSSIIPATDTIDAARTAFSSHLSHDSCTAVPSNIANVKSFDTNLVLLWGIVISVAKQCAEPKETIHSKRA